MDSRLGKKESGGDSGVAGPLYGLRRYPHPALGGDERAAGLAEPHRRRLLYLTGRDFPESEARDLWVGIERHREALRTRLGRDAGVEVAAFDYLKNVTSTVPDLRVIADEALDRLRGLARQDALTGVLNRRGFEPVLDRERARARREGSPLALLVIDVDHFKRVNDQHGHPAGDRVLARLAALLVRLSRGSDVTARIGGDEFVVLLPATGREGALSLAERIRQAVAQENLIGIGNGEAVTVSIGVSLDDGNGDCAAIAEADAALYRAKHLGRDRVAS
jgi:diguanylate cyclase (GGDEF)-like protein